MNIDSMFPKGVLRPELFMGVISSVSAYAAKVNLSEAGSPSGFHFSGSRYGKGEVGEFVLVEGQTNLLLGRLVEVKLPELERKSINQSYFGSKNLDAIGTIQLLGSVAMDNLIVQAGVENYPRLGDRVYSAPHRFVSQIPSFMDIEFDSEKSVLLNIGSIDNTTESTVSIKPEKLFGRHCAILGATGGGKSWTTAHLIEECLKYNSKIILFDPTGEYRDFSENYIKHYHLGLTPTNKLAEASLDCALPSNNFSEADFTALFRPSPGVQLPKFRDALISLRIVNFDPTIGVNGYFIKANRSYEDISRILARPEIAEIAYKPNSPFNIERLVGQIENECVWENPDAYGRKNDQHWGYCSTLVSRITNIINSKHLSFVFKAQGKPSISDIILNFISDKENRLLRISLAGVSHEFQSREIVANAIGRFLLDNARNDKLTAPLLVVLDEAHNFLGRNVGNDETVSRLDSFELIAKEGRKYGLNICLATQRPRDITEGVLSQLGALIVHRLTNDRDREVVEKACGEIDRAASAFLPNLKPGEAAIIGADFPIPLTVQIQRPTITPKSDGPDYQKSWEIVDE